jgi:hypothetical protein
MPKGKSQRKAPEDLGENNSLIVQTEKKQDESIQLRLIEDSGEKGGAVGKGQRREIVQHVEIRDRNGKQKEDHEGQGVLRADCLEEAEERQHGKDRHGAGEKFDRHAETKKSFRTADIIGRSRGVSSNHQCVGDVEKGEWSEQATYEIQERRNPGLFLE